MNNFIKTTTFFILPFLLQTTHAIIFNIQNNCRYTIWPAAVPGGGRRLDPGQTWTIGFPEGPKLAKIWARTNCTFDSSGRGSCLTGDCNGQLRCGSYGTPPHTLAEYGLNSFGHKDYYDVSVMEGFNVPMEFTPTTNGCTRPVKCAADIVGECPSELRVPGGCQNPCTVFKTTQYCCHSGPCRPTDLSRFFKSRCRDAFTYPEDDPTSTFICPPEKRDLGDDGFEPSRILHFGFGPIRSMFSISTLAVVLQRKRGVDGLLRAAFSLLSAVVQNALLQPVPIS